MCSRRATPIATLVVVCIHAATPVGPLLAADRPNVLLAISDDQSWAYASAYGCRCVRTPTFDRVAREGVLFNNAFGASPGCSPCRAALLTGRHDWQLEQAGTHASSFPLKYRTYPEILKEQGYFVGHTGKGWGPGNFKIDGREDNPAGPAFSKIKTPPPHSGLNSTDYAANFAEFLKARPAGQPFCFWYGATEPHRGYEKGVGLKSGKKLEDADVPPFLPDAPEVRSDILDYCVEIEWFDTHLGRMLQLLEDAGELDNTLIIVTSDNGMPFPRAKANCYEYGIHMPLAIRWGERVKGGRVVDDLVGFVDVTVTILEAANAVPGAPDVASARLAGHSLMNILDSDRSGVVDPSRTAVFSARERHSSSRYLNLSYPIRAMRTDQYLYVRNFRPERWPAGAPQKFDDAGRLGPMHGGYHDIDGSPTLSFLTAHADDPQIGPFLRLAVDQRPAVEVFDIKSDPGCLHNLAGRPDFVETETALRDQLDAYLRATGDPRIINPDGGDVFETYPRFSPQRSFPEPEWAKFECERREKDGWVRLFDGVSLDDWKSSAPADSFDIVNGAIRAHASRDQAHLFYTVPVADADFRDFELLIDCLATPGSNGGIYFHTRFQETDFPNDGHEVQVNNSHENKTRTGSLFAVVDLAESAVPDNAFFTQHITVRGKRVTVAVNGKQVVDYTEPKGYRHPRYTGRNVDHGTFALQAHDPGSTVFYRNLWARPLPASP